MTSSSADQALQEVLPDQCCSENGREVKDSEDGPVLHLHKHTRKDAGPLVGKSLCFRQLEFRSKPEECEGDIWHMIQHMRGDRHAALCWRPKKPVAGGYGEPYTWLDDGVGISIKEIAVMDSYEPLTAENEAKQFEQILLNAYHGDLDAVKQSFDEVEQLRKPKLSPLRPIGTIAAVMGHFHVVQYVLEKGGKMDRSLALAVRKGAERDAAMKELFEGNFEELNGLITCSINQNTGYMPNVSDEVRRNWNGFLDRVSYLGTPDPKP